MEHPGGGLPERERRRPGGSCSIAQRLAAWICALRYEDIPARVLEKARHQVLNVAAALHAGADTRACRMILQAVSGWGKAGSCTVIPTGEKMALHEAVLVNSAYSMALDYDDYLYMGHTGHSAVLASWGVCEEMGLTAREFLTAQVIANEIGGRVGASCVFGPQNGQAWSFVHAVAAAAAAARLFGLSEAQTANALAIALYQPPFTLWPGFMGPQSKVLTAAWPTVCGLQAAQFARQGLTGAREIFEHPRKGFWAFFTYVPLPQMLEGLGTDWVTDTLAFKRYPGCAYIDTTMDALFQVLNAYAEQKGERLQPEDVKRIDVEASLLSIEMDNLSSEHACGRGGLSPININFSIPFNVAIGLLAGRHTAAELRQEFLDAHEEKIRALAAKIRLSHNWEMSWRVVRAFATAGRGRSALSRLKPGDYLKVVRGYRSQLGGSRRTAVNVRSLFRKEGLELIKLIRQGVPVKDGPDGFAKFEMAFPARVTVVTRSGESFSSRQDIPFGAPGQKGYFETVAEKFSLEARAHLSGEQADRALTMIRRLESHSLQEISAVLCGQDGKRLVSTRPQSPPK